MEAWMMTRSLVLLLMVPSLAWANPTQSIAPIYPTGEAQQVLPGINTLVCGRIVELYTKLGSTKIAANVTTGFGAGKHVGFAIYPDLDAGTPIATSGAVAA